MTREQYVYVIEGLDGSPCYIGVGRGKRMFSHLSEARNGSKKGHNLKKVQYLSDCLAAGFVPQIYKVAEDLSLDEAFSYEKILIAVYGRLDIGTGCLLNANAGGYGGGRNPCQSTRDKMSELRKGRSHTLEHSAKISAALQGLKQSPEHIRKLVQTRLGRKASQEARAKMSVARKGKPQDPEFVARRTATLKGMKRSPASVSRMSLSQIGKKASAEAKAKMSVVHKGKPRPPEVRLKISEGHRRRRGMLLGI